MLRNLQQQFPISTQPIVKAWSAIAAHLPDEHFVIRVDGRVKSHHRRFLDALREGLQLRDQFPQHDVKVQSMKADGQQRTALH
jgi:hypothetical protein